MGRRIKVLLAIILLITVVFSASVAFKTYAKRASRVSHDSLYSDHGYVDYAKRFISMSKSTPTPLNWGCSGQDGTKPSRKSSLSPPTPKKAPL